MPTLKSLCRKQFCLQTLCMQLTLFMFIQLVFNDFINRKEVKTSYQPFETKGEKHSSSVKKQPDLHQVQLISQQPEGLQGISCAKLFDNDTREIDMTLSIQNKITYNESEEAMKLYEELRSCKDFLAKRNYITQPVSSEEYDFPIAYSILTYRDPQQTERLLRAIYRPQNYYCVHVDLKASVMVHLVTLTLANCFQNVFVATETTDVQWGWYSVAQPEVACLRDLIRFKKWKYFINLTGQEFPLKTNLELVRILKEYNGANDIQATVLTNMSQSIHRRFQFGYRKQGKRLKMYKKPPFQHNITWAKGAVHVAASRGFVHYLLHSQVGKDLIAWINDTSHGSEHLFNPLQMSPHLGVPGSYTGKLSSTAPGSKVRFKLWSNHPRKCHGRYTRDICILGVGDLPYLKDTPYLFVNKLFADFHPIAYMCLEEYIYNKTRLDVLGQTTINTDIYKNIDFVKYHLQDEESWKHI